MRKLGAASPPKQTKRPRIIYCSEPWFSHIREGRKTVEGLLRSPSGADAVVGEELIFICTGGGRHFAARVAGVTQYQGAGTLRRYLETETLARVLPGVETLAAGEAICLQQFSAAGVGPSSGGDIDRYGLQGLQVAVADAVA